MSKMFEDLRQGLAEVDGGEKADYKVTLPAEVDVKSIRKGQHDSGKLLGCFRLQPGRRHWEGGRRTPEASARAFLTGDSPKPGRCDFRTLP